MRKAFDAVPGELRRYIYAGGKILDGLVTRRAKEIAFFTRCIRKPMPKFDLTWSLRHAANKTPRARARMRPPAREGWLPFPCIRKLGVNLSGSESIAEGSIEVTVFRANSRGMRFSYGALELMNRYALFSPSLAPL
jgi:hypothetical protein